MGVCVWVWVCVPPPGGAGEGAGIAIAGGSAGPRKGKGQSVGAGLLELVQVLAEVVAELLDPGPGGVGGRVELGPAGVEVGGEGLVVIDGQQPLQIGRHREERLARHDLPGGGVRARG